MMPDDREHIEVSFQLTAADLLAARRYLLWRTTAGWLLPLLGVVLLGQAVGSGSWAFVVAAVAGIGIFGAWILHFQPQRAFRATPSLNGRQTWVLRPDGLSTSSIGADGGKLGSSELSWQSVVRVRESRSAFLISPSRNAAVVLPKRAVNPAQLDAVRALLAASVAPQR